MLDYFISLVGRLGQWGYLVLFLGAMLESAAFLGLIIPGESLMLVGGFFAAQGLLDLDALILIVAIGAATGDSIGYEMGRWMGRPALVLHGSRFGLSNALVEKAEGFFLRHGGKAVFLGRFVGFARALVPFLAGSSRMPYRQFLLYNLSGAALWSSCVVLLGYFLGASWRTVEGWVGRASAILGGILLFLLVLAWLWGWAVRHEADIKQYWMRLLEQLRLSALWQRLLSQIGILQSRLSPQAYLGLHLAAGAVILIGAGWIFGGITEDVLTGDAIVGIDLRVAQWFHTHAMPVLTRSMLVITHLHGPLAIGLFTFLAALYMAWKLDWVWLLCLGAVVPGGIVLNAAIQHALQWTHPGFDSAVPMLSIDRFPSSQVAAATLFYGVLGAILVSRIDAWRWRVLIVFAAIALVALLALARLYLGINHLSDVLAAFAEAIAWLTMCLASIHTYWLHRTARQRATAT
jgi:membrane protein DedA with SNARE-associated domain/membrane-associated phospholipid phosphatase